VALSSKLELQAITVMAQMLIEAVELSLEVLGHDADDDSSPVTTADALIHRPTHTHRTD
jgi:hypothetical protein